MKRPALTYESSGRWTISGAQYVITTTRWSAKIYKDIVGRTIKRCIRHIDQQRFQFVSTDNADEEERRIGQASEASFENVHLEPLPPNGYDGPSKPSGPMSGPDFLKMVKKAQPVTPSSE